MPKTYLCPECATEMIQSANGFMIHVESTDCAPTPWPDLLSVRSLVTADDGTAVHPSRFVRPGPDVAS